MKKIFALLTLMFALSIGTFAQSALNLQLGWSWSEGIASAGVQFKFLEVKAGWMNAAMPGSGDRVNGMVATVIVGPEWDESGLYGSYAFNSVGYRSQVDYGSGWTNDVVTGMSILSVGWKYMGSVVYLKADLGYGWCPDGSGMSYGVVMGIPISF